MYTECPRCHTVFRLSAAALQQASGQVRCGNCKVAFNALASLSEDPPPDDPASQPTQPPADMTVTQETQNALLRSLESFEAADVELEDTGIEWRVLNLDHEPQDDDDEDLVSGDDYLVEEVASAETNDAFPRVEYQAAEDSNAAKLAEEILLAGLDDEALDSNDEADESANILKSDDDSDDSDEIVLDFDNSTEAADEDDETNSSDAADDQEIILESGDEDEDQDDADDQSDDDDSDDDDADDDLDDDEEDLDDDHSDDDTDDDLDEDDQDDSDDDDAADDLDENQEDLDADAEDDDSDSSDAIDDQEIVLESGDDSDNQDDGTDDIKDANDGDSDDEEDRDDDQSDDDTDAEGDDSDSSNAIDDQEIVLESGDEDDETDEDQEDLDTDDVDAEDDSDGSDAIDDQEIVLESGDEEDQSEDSDDNVAGSNTDPGEQPYSLAELRFDDDTPLPDDYPALDFGAEPEPEQPPSPLALKTDTYPQEELAIDDADDWADLLDEFDDLISVEESNRESPDPIVAGDIEVDDDTADADATPLADEPPGAQPEDAPASSTSQVWAIKDMPAVEAIVMEGGDVYDSINELTDYDLGDINITSPEPADPGGKKKTSAWMVPVAALLIIVLLLQVAHAWREQLATLPYFNQTIGQLYRLFDKPVTANWDVTEWQFDTTTGNTNDSNTVLTIESKLSNRGKVNLPYPLIHVALTDRWEQVIGSRVIEPREYLGKETGIRDGVAPNASFNALINVEDPGTEADGFKLNVCYQADGDQLRCATGDFLR